MELPDSVTVDEMTHKILNLIALEYLASADFNGISARELLDLDNENFGAKRSADYRWQCVREFWP